jgi:hypothetical protein
MTYRIEKNVPLPESRGKAKSELRVVMESMEVGDSIVIPRTEIGRAEGVMNTVRAAGKRFATRVINEGIRIWRRE